MKKLIVTASLTLAPALALAHPDHGHQAYSLAHYLTGSHGLLLAGAVVAGLLAAKWFSRRTAKIRVRKTR